MKMFFILCLALVSALSGRAQIQYGVKAGINLSKYTYSGITSDARKYKTDFNFGVLANIPLSTDFFLQPEIMYSGEGYKWNVDSVGAGKMNTSNINLPILFKYQHRSGLFAETGPQIGFIIGPKSSYSTTNFSWVFGLGYKMPVTNVGIDVRYNLGISNISKDINSPNFHEKSQVFQISIFYLFGN